MRPIRELVDPFAWISGVRAALDYIEGEPNADTGRIGLWATSFGGGVAVHHAAHDSRVKALVVQVPAIAGLRGPALVLARRRAAAPSKRRAATRRPSRRVSTRGPACPGHRSWRTWRTTTRCPWSTACACRRSSWMQAMRSSCHRRWSEALSERSERAFPVLGTRAYTTCTTRGPRTRWQLPPTAAASQASPAASARSWHSAGARPSGLGRSSHRPRSSGESPPRTN